MKWKGKPGPRHTIPRRWTPSASVEVRVILSYRVGTAVSAAFHWLLGAWRGWASAPVASYCRAGLGRTGGGARKEAGSARDMERSTLTDYVAGGFDGSMFR
ncbi:hypothetical protein CLCR_03204 [Cladophialophora carrionii]|uniref:Uncharacterized protein n=1 Tax=Cladophialophora carrionii TaxID=86049 RepID=A0A1C1D2U8_9EURO|nr:hypothetical protein CLCR_03204 [Cladophialophora carrionii]